VAPRATGQFGGNIPSTIQYKNASTASLPALTYQNAVYGFGASDLDKTSTYPAFQFARGLTIGGLSDWYIPAKNELAILFNNLGPSFTTATDFKTGGTEAFITSGNNDYWSSTEDSSNTTASWGQIFTNGAQSSANKDTPGYIARAVRRVAA
jgi:hypothetical protein